MALIGLIQCQLKLKKLQVMKLQKFLLIKRYHGNISRDHFSIVNEANNSSNFHEFG